MPAAPPAAAAHARAAPKLSTGLRARGAGPDRSWRGAPGAKLTRLGPVAQRTEREPSKLRAVVRFHPGPPDPRRKGKPAFLGGSALSGRSPESTYRPPRRPPRESVLRHVVSRSRFDEDLVVERDGVELFEHQPSRDPHLCVLLHLRTHLSRSAFRSSRRDWARDERTPPTRTASGVTAVVSTVAS